MALIVCPECSKQISDQAAACPHCGYPLLIKTSTVPIKPVPSATKKQKDKITILICAFIAVLGISIFITCLLMMKKQNDEQKAYQASIRQESIQQESIRQESIHQAEAEVAARIEAYNQYVLTANTFCSSIHIGSDKVYSLCRITKKVWYNAIYQVDDPETDPYTKVDGVFVEDFNDALHALYTDKAVSKDFETAISYRQEAEELYKQLMSPPEELRDLSEKIKETYLVYRKYMALALETEGTLKSFTEDFSQHQKDFNRLYEELEILIPNYK